MAKERSNWTNVTHIPSGYRTLFNRQVGYQSSRQRLHIAPDSEVPRFAAGREVTSTSRVHTQCCCCRSCYVVHNNTRFRDRHEDLSTVRSRQPRARSQTKIPSQFGTAIFVAWDTQITTFAHCYEQVSFALVWRIGATASGSREHFIDAQGYNPQTCGLVCTICTQSSASTTPSIS